MGKKSSLLDCGFGCTQCHPIQGCLDFYNNQGFVQYLNEDLYQYADLPDNYEDSFNYISSNLLLPLECKSAHYCENCQTTNDDIGDCDIFAEADGVHSVAAFEFDFSDFNSFSNRAYKDSGGTKIVCATEFSGATCQRHQAEGCTFAVTSDCISCDNFHFLDGGVCEPMDDDFFDFTG